ncbi:phage portal protein [Candidatus Sneabacter namystus]|uniref:Phage portal protein n=2 Tax=Candidatus Sneabacter namystus TaxID=2601646 RepID=A0A5C0UIE0_9RICK|nr:phage portal protein [Candidatus Sneabacter namystus]
MPSHASPADYNSNPIVHRCVRLIAELSSHVPFTVCSKSAGCYVKNKKHFLNQVLKRPNPKQSGAEFFSSMITNQLLFGEAYILLIMADNSNCELYLLDNKNVSIISSDDGYMAYVYDVNNAPRYYPIDSFTQQSKVLSIKNYDPNNPSHGLSCIVPASTAIAVHNMSMQWNYSLLKNGARPSGAIVVKDSSRHLRDEQFQRLKSEIEEKYGSSMNAGKPMLLEGGLDWKEMSMSPKDMDFSESKDSSAREIALSCGVPPQLLGIKGDNTYNNMQEARISLWEETVIPLLTRVTDSLGHWLSYWLKEDISIVFCKNDISVLSEKRENLLAKISNISFISLNEKRAMVGLPPVKDGDKLM